MTTLRRHRSVDELRGVDATEAEQAPTATTARHLDETITLQGFYCLHDCRWPGTRNGRIDHVVIGATGVWVVADERPPEPVAVVDQALRTGRSSLSPELRRLRDQTAVLRGILGEVDVQPVLSIHEASLPRHSFQVDDVRVAASLWPTSQAIARPSAFLDPIEVERLARVAIEALRPGAVVGPRLGPPGAPVVSLPFVPAGTAIGDDRRADTPTAGDRADEAAAAHRRRTRLARRVALATVVALLAVGVAVELTGERSTLRGEPAEETPAEPIDG